MAAIARNRANDYHRHAVEEIELSDDQEEQGHRGTSRNSLDGIDAETALVLAAIRALPETYRETLLLRVVEGARPAGWPAQVLAAAKRDPAVPVVAPHGLCLEEVGYPPSGQLAERAVVTRRSRATDLRCSTRLRR